MVGLTLICNQSPEMKIMKFNPIRTAIEKLKSIREDPKKVCYGFAFGIFMCTTPFIGIKWILALPVLWLTKWNKTACMIGVFQVNSLTGPLYYAAAYFVGNRVCGFDNAFEMPDSMNFGVIKDLFFGSTEIFLTLLVGGLIISIPMTIGAFYLVKYIFSRRSNTQFI